MQYILVGPRTFTENIEFTDWNCTVSESFRGRLYVCTCVDFAKNNCKEEERNMKDERDTSWPENLMMHSIN